MCGRGITEKPLERECQAYSKKISEARSLTNVGQRVADAQDKMEKGFAKVFPFIHTFLIVFHWDLFIFDVTILFERDVTGRELKVEMKYSLFTVESDRFESSFGNQLMRTIQSVPIASLKLLEIILPALKHYNIAYAELEKLWKPLLVYQKNVHDPYQKHMIYFGLLDNTGYRILHCQEYAQKLLLMEKGTYDILDPTLPFPNRDQILYYLRHDKPHFRNLFFRFYKSQIVFSSEWIPRDLHPDLFIVILCKLIGL